MSDERGNAAGSILGPRSLSEFSRGMRALEELRDVLTGVVSTVYLSVPKQSSRVEERTPDRILVVSDKLSGREGALVGMFSVLSTAGRPVLFLRYDRPAPPRSLFELLLERFHGEKSPPALYVMDPVEKVPFPMVVHPRVTTKLRGFLRTHDPGDVEYFLRSIGAQKLAQ